MPELPEVETVRRGLAPYLEGATIKEVRLNRADLRFPFPAGFAAALAGQKIAKVERRAKYLLFRLGSGRTWLCHLGMSGSFRFTEFMIEERSRFYEAKTDGKHDHVVIYLSHPKHGKTTLIFADARRFGFMDLFYNDEDSPYLRGLGPEPLGNGFNADVLAGLFAEKKAPVKAALLDQRVVAGLGNIYVSEALHRAHIKPQLKAKRLVTKTGRPSLRLEDLALAIPIVLVEAIEVGGSTLRDFHATNGVNGAYQHRFAVYDREGEPCPTPNCTGTIARIQQSGRSSFYCPVCQT
jgi:formamidopyrimidine-DNA glycosylase